MQEVPGSKVAPLLNNAKIWKKAAVAYMKLLFWYLQGVTKEDHEDSNQDSRLHD
jgi:hypothetical protein